MKLRRNEWPIIVAGPPAPGFAYKNRRGDEMILTMTRKLYPVAELRQWSRRLKGKPVFYGHPAEYELGMGRGDPREYDQPDVGYIKVAGFNGKHRRIQAIMTVTDSEWQHTFEVARWDGTLNEYGFSMLPSVIERTVKLRSGQRLPKVEIVDIWSVDLVDEPLFGGRFMGPEPSPDRLLEAWAWQEKFIGD